MSRAGTFGVPYVGNDFGLPRIVKIKSKAPIKIEDKIEENIASQPIYRPAVRVSVSREIDKSLSYHKFWKRFAILSAVFVIIASASWLALANSNLIRRAINSYLGQTISTSVSADSKPIAKSIAAPVTTSATAQTQLISIENQVIKFTAGGSTITPSSDDIASWLNVTDGKDISVNTAAVSSYLSKIATELTVAPIDRLVVTHTDGTTAVLVRGTNGTNVSSIQPALNQISNNLLSGSGMNVVLPLTSTPFNTLTSPTEFNKLLEVDVTTKRMYAYQDGVLIRTFLVTAGAPATPTPLGQFTIWDKVAEQDMTGKNANGTTYNQPNVQWINYFDHSGDAVHGNYWRPLSVFGNVNTSHGCVGVVNSDAEWIYNWAPIGTTVITHA